MSSRYNLRRTTTQDPQDQYETVISFLKEDLRAIYLVKRKNDGKLLMKKTYGIRPFNDERFKHTRMAGSEIDILRTLRHSNIVKYVDGFYRDGPATRRTGREYVDAQAETLYADEGPRGALYTELCELDTLRHLRWRYTYVEGSFPPEVFVWHVLRCVLDALAYLHYGCAKVEELLEANDAGVRPHGDWQPISHGNVDLFHLYVKGDGRDGEGYPTIVLGSFGRAKRWPDWKVMDQGGSHDGKHPAELYVEWKEAARKDVEQAVEQVFSFCTGRFAKPTESDPDPDAQGPVDWPADYSQSLKHLLADPILTSRGLQARRYRDISQLAYAFRPFQYANHEYKPLPEHELSRLDKLVEMKTNRKMSDHLVYNSYAINDLRGKRTGVVRKWPCALDYLVQRHLDEDKPFDAAEGEAIREKTSQQMMRKWQEMQNKRDESA